MPMLVAGQSAFNCAVPRYSHVMPLPFPVFPPLNRHHHNSIDNHLPEIVIARLLQCLTCNTSDSTGNHDIRLVLVSVTVSQQQFGRPCDIPSKHSTISRSTIPRPVHRDACIMATEVRSTQLKFSKTMWANTPQRI